MISKIFYITTIWGDIGLTNLLNNIAKRSTVIKGVLTAPLFFTLKKKKKKNVLLTLSAASQVRVKKNPSGKAFHLP